MKKLGFILTTIFLCLVAFYIFVLRPEKYVKTDMYEDIMKRGIIKAGVNSDVYPFGFRNKSGELEGYDIDLARYIAQYLLGNQNSVKFVPVNPKNRLIKLSTGEVDIVVSSMTITPAREEIINFSKPYGYSGLAILVKSSSGVKSIADLTDLNIGVIWGTTAEKNMQTLVPTGHVVGFKTYNEGYNALKKGYISALASDDTILNGYTINDDGVRLLPKRYSREPYGIGFRKGKGAAKLQKDLDFAISDMDRKNILKKLHNKWFVQK